MGKIHPVLLSGGAGSRLWPLSREGMPKQFLPLVSDQTLFQQAALRVADAGLFEPLRVIGSADHRFLVAQQLQDIGVAASTIVLEPSARSTTAAAAVAALLVVESDPSGLVLLVPADHRIVNVEAFHAAVRIAAGSASTGLLSLFGIAPDRPSTGYGYIRVGEPIAGVVAARRVAAFVEKPDRETAERYLRGGDHLWNSGIFLLPAAVFLAELSRFEPELLAHARQSLERASRDADFLRLDQEAFDRCRSVAVDLAVMERSDRMAVVPVDCGWTDVGSWSTLADVAERDVSGNTSIGEVLTEGTKNSYIRSSGPLVATVGVENLIVVATPDAILVAHKDHDQDIKRIVDRLRDGKHGRIGRSPPPRSGDVLRKIVFVCYGPFDCNSAGHMAGFANAFAGMSYSVAACAPGDVASVNEFGPPAFEHFSLGDLARKPDAVIGIDGSVQPKHTVFVCWTPREIVRRVVEPLVARYGIPYVVHLEDNEEHIANLKLQTLKHRPWRKAAPVPESISDPEHFKKFLTGARGLTLIEGRLREIVPAGPPTLLLEPCIDLEVLGAALPTDRRADIRDEVGCPPDTTMLVYPGNVHRANAEEVGALYEAVRLLRERGRNVTLVRTGTDASAAAKFLKHAGEHGIIALGRVERPFLIELLKSADLFVQPGKPGPFNDFRLPSKLPEFMAVGRPIVLPATNVGARLRHGIDAMLIQEGSPDEIARLVGEILSDPALSARLSANAKAFAAQHYEPGQQARKLEGFLRQVI